MVRPASYDEGQPDRRRASRAALRLEATMRDGSRKKVRVRLIDISTHGCRIECNSTVVADARIGLSIAGLETQHCRVVWRCEEFAGLEFEQPVAGELLERLLQDQAQLPATGISELRDIAARTHGMARRADDADIHILAELSRKCAVDAVVEGLRLGSAGRDGKPPAAD